MEANANKDDCECPEGSYWAGWGRIVCHNDTFIKDEDEEDEVILEADAVVDATGTYGQRNWLGAGGMPALGERGCCLLGSKRGASADDDNNSDTSGPLIEDVIP